MTRKSPSMPPGACRRRCARRILIEEVLKASDFITLHVPLVNATRNLINAERMHLLRKGAMLLNFSRDGIVDDGAVIEALNAKKLRAYVCDFPAEKLAGHPQVVALPHLGASTDEAQDEGRLVTGIYK